MLAGRATLAPVAIGLTLVFRPSWGLLTGAAFNPARWAGNVAGARRNCCDPE